jgi:hypothetical protein
MDTAEPVGSPASNPMEELVLDLKPGDSVHVHSRSFGGFRMRLKIESDPLFISSGPGSGDGVRVRVIHFDGDDKKKINKLFQEVTNRGTLNLQRCTNNRKIVFCLKYKARLSSAKLIICKDVTVDRGYMGSRLLPSRAPKDLKDKNYTEAAVE